MDYIKINEKEYPIIFNILVFKKFSLEKGINDLNKIDAVFAGFTESMGFSQMDEFTSLTCHAIREGCRQELKEFDLSFDDIFVFLFDLKSPSAQIISEILGRTTKTAKGEESLGEAIPQA